MPFVRQPSRHDFAMDSPVIQVVLNALLMLLEGEHAWSNTPRRLR